MTNIKIEEARYLADVTEELEKKNIFQFLRFLYNESKSSKLQILYFLSIFTIFLISLFKTYDSYINQTEDMLFWLLMVLLYEFASIHAFHLIFTKTIKLFRETTLKPLDLEGSEYYYFERLYIIFKAKSLRNYLKASEKEILVKNVLAKKIDLSLKQLYESSIIKPSAFEIILSRNDFMLLLTTFVSIVLAWSTSNNADIENYLVLTSFIFGLIIMLYIFVGIVSPITNSKRLFYSKAYNRHYQVYITYLMVWQQPPFLPDSDKTP